jgi:pimeloyl-ACP methyl ester carboxylesterase
MRGPLAVHWHDVAGRPVRSLVADGRHDRGRAEVPDVPDLVVVPGLGVLGYLLPFVRACASWARVHLLDVPGFGAPATCRLPADLPSLGEVVAGWLDAVPPRPVVLLGHSTGAQVALRAAAAAPATVRALVLAGPTFPPEARRPLPVARRALRTAPHEEPGELLAVLPYWLRGARRLPQLVRSGLEDRPEQRVGEVCAPVLVLRGRADHLCPQPWVERLAEAAGGRLEVLPGGHNFPYSWPDTTSSLVRSLVIDAPSGDEHRDAASRPVVDRSEGHRLSCWASAAACRR